jgi:hypothetical protein
VGEIFQREYRTYEALKSMLLGSAENQFVLIKAATLAGIYPDFQSALEAGYEKFGLVSFFIRKIEAVDKPLFLYSGYLRR